jgi:hypothetical protein
VCPVHLEEAMEWLPEVPDECERPNEVFSGQEKSLSTEQFDRLTSLLPLWWQKGGRHSLAMSIAGVMAKEGYSEAEADRLVCAVCGRSGDLEYEDRRAAVRDTYHSAALGQQVVSWSGIEGVYPNDSVAYFRNILAAPTLVTDRGPPDEEDDRYQTPFRLTERQDFPVTPQLMYGILPSDPRGVVGYLAGLSQSFKSYLALDWGCHISLGLEWQGHQTTQGQVLYVAGEGQYGDLLSRMRAWEAANGCKAPDFYTRLSPIYLDDPGKVERALARIGRVKDLSPKLVILDTLSQCAGDVAENSSDDARRIYQACKKIGSHFGATVLVIHHAGKADGSIMRGSSALFDDSDFVYEMRRPGWQNGGLDCTLNCKKLKNGKPLFNHCMMARLAHWEADGESGADLTLVQMMVRSAMETTPNTDWRPK